MRTGFLTLLLTGAVALTAPQNPGTDPYALQRMVATELAFAEAAAHIGVRDAFLTFFGEDSIYLIPGPDGSHPLIAAGLESLRRRPQETLPLVARLAWAPYTGHISADGSLGWLTGGYTRIDEKTRSLLMKGAYFSVWKRQPSGTYRVWLDFGIDLPEAWQDAAPFRPAPEPDTSAQGVPGEPIEDANARVAAGGDAWRSVLSHAVRLHRNGHMPIVGAEAAARFMAETWSGIQFTTARTVSAGSEDLSVTLGGYEADTHAGREHGTWARVWRRNSSLRWSIVFETSRAAPAG